MADKEGPPAFGKKTFAEILATASLGTAINSSVSNLNEKPKIGLHKGKPSVLLSKQLVSALSLPYKRSLVGKFSQGRPTLEDIHSYFVSLDLKDHFQIGLLDARHIIVNFQCDEDYHRIYSRRIWYLGESVMRILKWSKDFHVDKEPPIVPVWIEMEKLPIFLFQKDVLFTLASTIGQPLRLDAATAAIRKPSVAKIQVELDLLKEHPDMIWIGIGDDDGFWQKIKYCNVPSYCTYCSHVGHALEHCHVKNPAIRNVDKEAHAPAEEGQKVFQEWREVRKVQIKKTGPLEETQMQLQQSQKGKEIILEEQISQGKSLLRTEELGPSTSIIPSKSTVMEEIRSKKQNTKTTDSQKEKLSPDETQELDMDNQRAAVNLRPTIIHIADSPSQDNNEQIQQDNVPDESAETQLEQEINQSPMQQHDNNSALDQSNNIIASECPLMDSNAESPSDPPQQILEHDNLIVDFSSFSLHTGTELIPDQNIFAVLARAENLNTTAVEELVEQLYIEAAPSQVQSSDAIPAVDEEVVSLDQMRFIKEGNLSPRKNELTNRTIPTRAQSKKCSSSKKSSSHSLK